MRDDLREGTPLAEALAEGIERFEPVEALRLLELMRGADTSLPLRGAITNRHMGTPLARDERSGDVEVAFVGLMGPLGPLPPTYTELAVRSRKQRNMAFQAFYDIFLARIVALFVRVDEKYRLPALVARHGVHGADTLIEALYATIGLGLSSLRSRLAKPDSELLPYAGLLANDIRSAAGLEILLRDELGAPVRVVQFRRRWLPIAPEEQSRISASSPAFSQLGVDAVAGSGIFDASSTFRIVIGPVGYADFLSLGPGGKRMAEIVELVRFYMDPGLDFDVQVILRKEDVPESQLGERSPTLGWNSWLRQLPAEKDADEAVCSPAV